MKIATTLALVLLTLVAAACCGYKLAEKPMTREQSDSAETQKRIDELKNSDEIHWPTPGKFIDPTTRDHMYLADTDTGSVVAQFQQTEEQAQMRQILKGLQERLAYSKLSDDGYKLTLRRYQGPTNAQHAVWTLQMHEPTKASVRGEGGDRNRKYAADHTTDVWDGYEELIPYTTGTPEQCFKLLVQSVNKWGGYVNLEEFGAEALTLSVVESDRGPIKPGDRDVVLLQVRFVSTGGVTQFRMPALVFRRSGGAPWKSLSQVRNNLSDIRVIAKDGTLIVEPIIEVVGDEQCLLRDESTLVCHMKNKAWEIPNNDPQLLTVMASIGGNADIATISAALEPGIGNLTGAVSGKHGSSGAAVGATRAIRP